MVQDYTPTMLKFKDYRKKLARRYVELNAKINARKREVEVERRQ